LVLNLRNMNKQKIFLLILGLLALHMVLSAFLPLPDPSEARYATIAKYMAESNNYVMPHIWIEGKRIPFMGKPPFGFWMMAGAIELFGANEFAVRLPAFVASLLLLLIIFHTLKKTKGIYQAVVTSLITATTIGFYILSGVVLVDMWLCLFSIGAIFWYYAFIHEKNRKIQKCYSLLVFIFLAGAFLTKGPVGLVFFGLPVFFWTLLSNRWDTLKYHAWISGVVLFLLIVIPWFILAEQSTKGYLHYFFVVENFKRFVSSDKSGDIYSGISHAVPRGTAILYSLAVCFPWVLIQLVFYSIKKKSAYALFRALKQGLKNLKENWFAKNKQDFDLFLIGLVSITLFWCLSSHLMLYYMVLITPLFAVWSAGVFYKYNFSYNRIAKLTVWLLVVYSIAYVPIYFFVDIEKSKKTITLKAIQLYDDNNLQGKIIFARKLHYSAYFYGGNLIMPHEKEKVPESILRISEPKDSGDIYVLRKRYIKRIPEEMKDKFKIEYQDKNWALLTRKKKTE
jgi:4-amino-4-deoxy-L-arabinose transferase-like glycosyltransferase